MMDKFTDFLERFGIKQKAVENVAIMGQIDNRIIVEVIDNNSLLQNENPNN
jgi:hypothetical protein